MTENPDANQKPWRFQKGQSGNPAGKPKGTRHKATLAAEALFDGEAERLTRTAIDKALEGDATALRLCLERILPPRRDRPVSFAMPRIESADDAAKGMGAILLAVAAGELTPGVGAELSKLVEGFIRTLEAVEIEGRLARLEERMPH